MQHRYAADVGDFGKYALLRALSEGVMRLGVIWYLNLCEEKNQDGRFTDYSHLADCSPTLYGRLQSLIHSNQRTVQQIECGEILPATTCFFHEALPVPSSPCLSRHRRDEQARSRVNWFDCAMAAVADAEIVFMDPDNGLAGSRMRKHVRRSVKFAFEDEVARLVGRGQSVVLYQHQQRKHLADQIVEQRERFSTVSSESFALTFHARSARIYYVLPASRAHADHLKKQADAFVSSTWKNIFRLVAG